MTEIKEFKFIYGRELTFGLAVKLIYHAKTFLNPLIIGLAIFGLIVPKRISWILVSNIFVYFIAIITIIILPTEDEKLIPLIFVFVAAGLLGLMNLKETRDFYQLEKKDLLTFNLFALTIGLCFALLKGYFIVNPGPSIYEILY
jgi:hypothetical protein